MAGLDALQSVQYISAKGKRFAVVDMDDWETLLEWLETIEDIQIAREAYAKLEAANGSRQEAGWLDWNDVKHELE